MLSVPSSWGAGPGGGAIAVARGLVRFPCRTSLSNVYHFLRSGSSLLEVENVWSTNPLFLRVSGRSLPDMRYAICRWLSFSYPLFRVGTGCECGKLRRRHPHGRAVQSRGRVRGHHRHRRGGSRIGRDRLVPEFNYMNGETVRSSSFIHHFCLFLFFQRNVVAIIILSPAFSVVQIHRERTSSSLLSQGHRRLGLRGAERDVGGRVGPRRRRGRPVRQGRQAPAERGRQPRRDAVGPGRQAKKIL